MSSRTVRISNSRLNSYGFRLLTSGADLTQYQKNPILLFMHNRPWRGTTDEILPIGYVENIRVEGDDILGELKFDEKDDFARRIAQKWDDGIYRSVSVGVDVLEMSSAPEYILPGQTRATVTRWKLNEISVVDIGANEDAMALTYAGKEVKLGKTILPDFIPKIITNEMKQIALKLGLMAEAKEDDVLNAIETLQQENARLKTEAQKAEEAAIVLAVDTAIKERRINDPQRNHFIELGKMITVEKLKTTLAAIEPAVKPADFIRKKSADEDSREETFDYLQKNNPARLAELRKDDPEKYQELAMKYFEEKKKNKNEK